MTETKTGKKKVAIVGAGTAGLEAAKVAAERGFDVVVYEKSDRIGGQVNLASVPPRKSELMRRITTYGEELPKLGVRIELNHPAQIDELNQADAVIIATGSKNTIIPVPGHDGPNVVSAWDLLDGKKTVKGSVVVIGGGLVGVETAEYLLEKGCSVAVVEMMDQIAPSLDPKLRPYILKQFEESDVKQYVHTRLSSIDAKGVHAVDTQTNAEIYLPCDYVVMAVGSTPTPLDVTGIKVPVSYAGDCAPDRTHSIAEAMVSGAKAAKALDL